jgi:pSer/pThr/pTyr-binding forkhead associated (FHA) protein
MNDCGKLVLLLPGGQQREFALSKATVSIGRGATSDIILADSRVSRSHTRIECGAEGCFVVDLGSANGTRLNGQPVGRASLLPGDIISVGGSTLRYEAGDVLEEGDLTRIDTESDLETTLMGASIATQLSETRIPRLAVHTSRRTWEVPLDGDSYTIGRHPNNDIVVDSQKASRFHARVERHGAGFGIQDLNSDNGTWIGQERVTKRTLNDGDGIRVGGARLTFKAGFVEEDLTVVDQPRIHGRNKHPVVVIPGFMGSDLWHGSEKIWPNPRRFFKNPELMKFREGDTRLVAKGLVDEVVIVPNLIKLEQYGGLTNYLVESLGYEAGNDMLEFPYDFRQDVRTSARQMAQAIEQWGVRAPITIVAHSMGSLVARYYVNRLGGHKAVERLVLLGGPHLGVPKVILNLAANVSLLPFGLMGDRLREILVTYPSIYQLLPEYPCGVDQNGKPIH